VIVPRVDCGGQGGKPSPHLADEGWLPFSVPMGALSWHSQTQSVYCVMCRLSKWGQGTLIFLPRDCDAGSAYSHWTITS
jgi:hypothetical protein